MVRISIMAAKVLKKFLVRKGLRKTAGKSAQNDKEPQPLEKH